MQFLLPSQKARLSHSKGLPCTVQSVHKYGGRSHIEGLHVLYRFSKVPQDSTNYSRATLSIAKLMRSIRPAERVRSGVRSQGGAAADCSGVFGNADLLDGAQWAFRGILAYVERLILDYYLRPTTTHRIGCSCKIRYGAWSKCES
jgi:hypothetical protein